jgi:PadR family transcriptional regulator PadR
MLDMVKTDEPTTVTENVMQELRRGILILAILSQLNEEKYGYALISELAEVGLTIDQGTLYPLLRRLEAQGLLDSQWNTDGSRPRRYYVINKAGKAILKDLAGEWRSLTQIIGKLLTKIK